MDRIYPHPLEESTVKDLGCCKLEYIVAVVLLYTEKDRIQDCFSSIHPRRLANQSKVKSVMQIFLYQYTSSLLMFISIHGFINETREGGTKAPAQLCK